MDRHDLSFILIAMLPELLEMVGPCIVKLIGQR